MPTAIATTSLPPSSDSCLSPAANSVTEGSDSGNEKRRTSIPQEDNTGVVEIDTNDDGVSASPVSKSNSLVAQVPVLRVGVKLAIPNSNQKYTKDEVLAFAVKYGKSAVISAIHSSDYSPKQSTLKKFFTKKSGCFNDVSIQRLLNPYATGSNEWHAAVYAISSWKGAPALVTIHELIGYTPPSEDNIDAEDEELAGLNAQQASVQASLPEPPKDVLFEPINGRGISPDAVDDIDSPMFSSIPNENENENENSTHQQQCTTSTSSSTSIQHSRKRPAESLGEKSQPVHFDEFEVSKAIQLLTAKAEKTLAPSNAERELAYKILGNVPYTRTSKVAKATAADDTTDEGEGEDVVSVLCIH